MTSDPWQLEELDLPAYLDVVGVSAQSPSLEALAELHEAHVRAFPFENLDVLLEDHPGVALPVVAEKFVQRRRGGYCFEHATLFAGVLERLGYDVRRHLGRVGDSQAPRTHAVVEVVLDGRRWLCDPGFGMSLLQPIEMTHGAEVDDHGWHYRLLRHDDGGGGPTWELQRLREAGWELMHLTDELPVRPVDIVMGHHFTSTAPTSHFRSGLILTRHLGERHVTVTHETVTVRRAGAPTDHRPLRPAELPELFAELGVTLTVEAQDRVLARLSLRRPRRRPRPATTRSARR